ncbi:ribosome-associated translation inhibitor RaiA [Patescibacteria group bacterium]|nr:ribosome-associated translation inhibitor RaiA [Patescibacteria group bacterium]
MKIEIETKNIKLSSGLQQFAEEKLNSLEKFAAKVFEKDRFLKDNERPKAEMWLELGKITLHHQKGKIFRAEAQLKFPGRKSIRAEAVADDFRKAIIKVKDELQKEFKTYKEKIITKSRKTQKIFKKNIHPSL